MNEIVMEITPEMEGERIDKCISNYLESLSRSYIQKIIKDGKAYVNDAVVKANYKVKVDDKVQFEIPDCEEPDIPPQDIPLDILYEDKDILIVNKPKDMVVHPAPGHYEGTLVNAIMFHCKDELSGINGVLRPGIVHRIDKDTTGSIIICKNDEAHRKIAQQLKEHSITRKYRAIVYGRIMEEEGTVNAPIGRHPTDRKKMAINEKNGKPAVTHYKVLERFDKYTYIECQLETGRTHQEVKYQPCGPVQTLSHHPKLPPAAPNPEKHFSKISPGEFSKTAAMQRGCCFCDPPLYLLESKVFSLSKR